MSMTTDPTDPTPEPKLIPPRTTSERRAYVQGWIDSINMIDSEGLSAARAWLRQMAELELELMNRERAASDEN
jgi:hypothetical protein